MKLTARQVETAKPKDKPYKPADGGGLYLLVNPNGKIRCDAAAAAGSGRF